MHAMSWGNAFAGFCQIIGAITIVLMAGLVIWAIWATIHEHIADRRKEKERDRLIKEGLEAMEDARD